VSCVRDVLGKVWLGGSCDFVVIFSEAANSSWDGELESKIAL
jgi:hypothetical protein